MPSRPVKIPAELKTALGGLKVQAKPCPTCIYRQDSPLDVDVLEDVVRDEYIGFKGYRICHHSADACCRGFWNRHKDEFAAGQIAQRLGLVEYVTDENWTASEEPDG
jgi:hypothetical protein